MDSLQAAVCDGVDLGVPNARWPDLGAWRRGGIRAQVFAIWIDTIYAPYHAARRALQQVDAFHQLCERHPDLIELARTASDVRRIAKTGRLAGLLALEGGVSIQNDLALLRNFHRLGVSSMTLTHSNSIDWVDASTDAPRSNGLSEFGREVIAEMNRLGMVIDVSHTSDQAVRDVLAASAVPIVASHSNAKALCDHPRNLPDELIRATAERGGVVGVNFYTAFVDISVWQAILAQDGDLLKDLNSPPDIRPEDLDAEARKRLSMFFRGSIDPPPLDRLIDHIVHLIDVAGPEHVGIGSDLGSPNIPLPLGIATPEDFPKVTEAMSRRGISEGVVERILGLNFLRVWEGARG